MITHETKRILGTTGLLFIVALLVARALPLPLSGFSPGTRPSTEHRFPPSLVFADNVSVVFGGRFFNLSLTGSHHYLWWFNVTYGSMMVNLTDSASGAVDWSVGPRSTGSMYLSGIGVASFNWTTPMSSFYLLSFQSLSPSRWGGVSGSAVCDVRVWDMDSVEPSFSFHTS